MFFCFQVSTGKIHTCNRDNKIRRPPYGFDCVSGPSGSGKANDNIFTLYGGDVRRAYPAYEVIYK